MHDFHTGNRTAGCPKGLKAQHRVCEAFHSSMILFDNIIEIFDVADCDRGAVLRIIALDGGFIGSVAKLLLREFGSL